MSVIRGSYRRLGHQWRPGIGWMRYGCQIAGIWVAVGRRGWYAGTIGRGPCRHQRRADDLQRRLDRTVAYLDELAAGPLPNQNLRVVIDAARRGLLVSAPRGDAR